MQEWNKGLETLKVWRMAVDLAAQIYHQILPLLPREEKWGLSAQLRRSAQSVPANLAEGYGRYYYQDNVRFCYIARGSLEETFSHLTLANELGFIQEEQFSTLIQEIIELRKMINGYIAFLKQSKRGATEPGANLVVHYESSNYQPELAIESDEPLPNP